MDATWRPTRFVRVPVVKVTQEIRVQNQGARDPGAFLGTVPLPVYQVLVTSTPPADIKNLLDCECWETINQAGRGRWRIRWRMEGAIHHRFKERDMEDGVNLECSR